MLCPVLHYLMREWGGKPFRLLQRLAYFGWCLRNAPTSSSLSSSAFCSFKWGSHNCSLCKAGVLEQTLKKKCWYADCSYAQACLLVSVALFLRYFPQPEINHNVILAFLCSQPNFHVSETGKPCPGSFPHSTGLTVSQCRFLLVTVATSLSSLWHHINGHSVVCFVVVSLVLKDLIAADSVFYREQVIQSQNTVPFFCFPTCHCFLFYSEVLLIAAAFVQALSHIDFPSPKLYIKECGIKEKIFSFYR